MKKQLLLFMFIYCLQGYSQQYILNQELVKSFLVDDTKAKSMNVTLTSKMDEIGVYEFILTFEGNSKNFKVKPLTYPDFEAKFKSTFIDLIKETEDNTGSNTMLVPKPASSLRTPNNDIALLFTQMVTYYNTENEKPEVATIHLNQNIPVYYNLEKIKDEKVGELENVIIEISFFGGFIEKIQVNGRIKGKDVSFNNEYSIGISSTKNIRQLSDYVLYTTEQFLLKDIVGSTEAQSLLKTNDPKQEIKNKGKRSLFLYLDAAIRYVKKVDVNANDISPTPQLIILDEQNKDKKLYREESTKLFEAVVYTDFLGIFNEENPNGIVQTEISKQFNLNTKRQDTRWFYMFLPPSWISEGIGFFQSFDAKFHYSKIEKDNKFLVPEIHSLSNGQTEAYYTNLSVLQYRIYSVGGTLNIFFWENQNAKLNSYLNTGFLFGSTGVKESEDQEEGVFLNNIEIPFEYSIHLLPEKRFSFTVTDRLSWFEVLDSEINLKSIEDAALVSENRWINTFNINVNVDLSSTGRLFLRYKLTHELDNINNNFSQLQFGYSFYLLQKNGNKKNNVRFN